MTLCNSTEAIKFFENHHKGGSTKVFSMRFQKLERILGFPKQGMIYSFSAIFNFDLPYNYIGLKKAR